MVSFWGRNDWLSVIILSIIASIVSCAKTPTLRLVNVVFRHGDRTPDPGSEMYPNDPYLNSDFYPYGLGQLTNDGKMREYELGLALRRRYANFLGKIYLPQSVVAHSSDYDRTKMSLQLVLAALFPPEPIQQWNPALKWQPIPATYVKRVEDNLFLSDECPLFLAEYARVLELPEVAEEFAQFNELRKNLSALTGKDISKPLDLYYLYHTFVSEDALGLSLPSWAEDLYPNGKLFDGIVFSYDVGSYSTLLKRLYAGPMLRLWTDSMKAVRNGTLPSERKLYLYSGHETNIASMLHALNVYKPHVPEYSSAIFLELYELNDKYYVQALYYTGIPPITTKLKLPGCEFLCPLDDFLRLTKNLIPTNEELKCDKRKSADYANVKLPSEEQESTYNFIRRRRIANVRS